MTYDKNRPVSSIKHDDKRAAIPDSAHQGEEQMAISGMPEQSEYDIFRHEFQRGRDPELYWQRPVLLYRPGWQRDCFMRIPSCH